jgi:excisionase family DNA binding protein
MAAKLQTDGCVLTEASALHLNLKRIECSRAAGLSLSMIDKLIRERKILSLKIGRRVVIPRDAFLQWLAQQQQV